MNRRIAFVAIATALTTTALPAQPAANSVIVNGPVAARADSALKALEAQGMSGVFLVAKGGDVILQKGYGLANRATRRAFTPDIVTQIGSGTKDFTAVAILQLADRGKLSVDDKLTRWFPDAPADKRAITVAQVLDHTAGFEEYSGGDFDAVTRDQFVAHMLASKLRFAPGASEQYSNPGYGLLAVIIEKVSGTPFDVYVRDNILAPLGLKETGYLLPKFDLARVSHGYGPKGDNGTILAKPHAADGPYWNLRGNGGMVSTVGDMFRFYSALFSTEKLLKFGSRHGRFPPNEPVGLAGSDGTHFFLYERAPAAGVSYIIATNNADWRGPRVRLPLERALGLGGGQAQQDAGTPAPAGGRVVLPDTPAGAAFAKYMAAFNSGDTTRMMRFVTDMFAPNPNAPPMAQRMGMYRRMLDNLGKIVPTAVEASEPAEITVVTKNKQGDEIAIRLSVEPDGAHRITRIGATAR